MFLNLRASLQDEVKFGSISSVAFQPIYWVTLMWTKECPEILLGFILSNKALVLYLSTSPFIIKNLGALSCMSLPEDDPESSGDECLAIIFRALNQQKPPGGRILPQALLEKDLVRITSALCTVTLPSRRFLRCSQQRHPLQTYFPSYYTLIVGPCCQLALSAN